MSIINLTPHPVHVLDSCNNVLSVIPASGKVARAERMTDLVGFVDGLPLAKEFFGHPTLNDGMPLPSPQEGVYLLVSGVIASALKGKRNDLLVPVIQVKGSEGTVIGCRALAFP